ncbi:MAG: RNA polymerase sigma factor [Deltaproteobacteria bacterium]|nr:RNA polymerase sigma factor [Deltaproteobacteria bacterium]
MNEAGTKQRPIEELVTAAVEGSRSALEEIVLRIQDRVYHLALRMLSHPEDARDASQEILIKVITNLKGFRFEGPFEAWIFRIAANHLNTFRKSRMEQFEISWDKACGLVDQAEARGWLSDPPAAPNRLLEIEARLRCTQALLTAMNRPHRLAFILGVVMDVSSRDGAYILEISPAAFRRRISRARAKLKAFLAGNCGLFDTSNRCSCPGVLANHLQNQWISPENPVFMKNGSRTQSNEDLAEYLKELDELSRVSTLFKAYPESPCPPDISHKIKRIIDQKTYRVLTDPGLH